jgi:hypothetical protein
MDSGGAGDHFRSMSAFLECFLERLITYGRQAHERGPLYQTHFRRESGLCHHEKTILNLERRAGSYVLVMMYHFRRERALQLR